jgi:hypothetical protein
MRTEWWWVVHNVFVHPLIALPGPPAWVVRLHDWTAERAESEPMSSSLMTAEEQRTLLAMAEKCVADGDTFQHLCQRMFSRRDG